MITINKGGWRNLLFVLPVVALTSCNKNDSLKFNASESWKITQDEIIQCLEQRVDICVNNAELINASDTAVVSFIELLPNENSMISNIAKKQREFFELTKDILDVLIASKGVQS